MVVEFIGADDLSGFRVTHIHQGVQLWGPLAELLDPVWDCGQGHNHQEGPLYLQNLRQVAWIADRVGELTCALLHQ